MKKYNKSDKAREKEVKVLLSVSKLIQEGRGVSDACDEVGIHKTTYYKMKKRYKSSDFDKIVDDQGFSDWNHGWLKVDGASIHIKNEKPEIDWEKFVGDQVGRMKKYAPKYPKVKRQKIKDKHLLIVDPADIHVGKLSSAIETGETYNVDIAVKRSLEGVDGILEKASGFPLDEICLIIGNDILHIDNPQRKTTAGTPQDTDGMWHECYNQAVDLYVKIIEKLIPIAPVRVVYNPSNHDYQSGFSVAATVAAWFNNCKDVEFDTTIKHRKYFKYGNNLIGSTHGDGAKEGDLNALMAHESGMMWGECSHRYFYLHHKHHKIAKDVIGLTLEYLRTPSAPDSWHDRNGYKNIQAVEGFVIHKEDGQLARLTHLF